MKKLLACLILATSFTNLYSQRIEDTNSPKKEITERVITDATIDFKSKVIDYGTIENKSDGSRKFVFTNNGSEPLLIKNAKGSCGCTVPTWPREAIAPGASGEIGVKYDTKRTGKFTKTITLTTNAQKTPVILTIKGDVKPPSTASQDLQKKTGPPFENK
jgi:hypothetical protein